VNVELFLRVKEAQGDFVSIAELSAFSQSVARDVEEWTRFGYALEQHPYLGVAYRGPATRLCPDYLEHRLNTVCVGRRIAVWQEVGSTNDLAARAAHSAANSGLVILAESQTSGRGRRGNSWCAPPFSSLLMSVVLFPNRPLDDPKWLTALGAVAAAEVIEEAIGQPARIKWPNDVRIGGSKIAGILVERSVGSIVGIGVNINTHAHEFPPEIRQSVTSLRIARGEIFDRSEIARNLMRRLDHLYAEGIACGPDPLSLRWRDRLEALGALESQRLRCYNP
jgi:BirA family biotin operon repressor/biotin-[acetyl-CoA-carboxylase] ligase